MIIGRLQTERFEWVTLTDTPEQALTNLRDAWESHAQEKAVSFSWDFVSDSVTLEPINLGDTHTTCNRCENLAHTN